MEGKEGRGGARREKGKGKGMEREKCTLSNRGWSMGGTILRAKKLKDYRKGKIEFERDRKEGFLQNGI